jgi:hypothetical protein
MKPSDYRDYEVWGIAVAAYVPVFRQYPTVGDKYFDPTRFGISREGGGEAWLERLRGIWIPLEAWLSTMHALVQEVGAATVFSIGKRVSEGAPLPPQVDNVAKVLQGIDDAYHIYHRKNGVVMLDPATGKKLDGIGTYATTMDASNSSATVQCLSVPYECDLDRGILAGFAGRFEPAVSVTHVQGSCRKKGDSSCSYLVQW